MSSFRGSSRHRAKRRKQYGSGVKRSRSFDVPVLCEGGARGWVDADEADGDVLRDLYSAVSKINESSPSARLLMSAEAVDAIAPKARQPGMTRSAMARLGVYVQDEDRKSAYEHRRRMMQVNALDTGNIEDFWRRNRLGFKRGGCCQVFEPVVPWQYDENGDRRCGVCWRAYEKEQEDCDE